MKSNLLFPIFIIFAIGGFIGCRGKTGPTGPTGPMGPGPTQYVYAGNFPDTSGSDFILHVPEIDTNSDFQLFISSNSSYWYGVSPGYIDFSGKNVVFNSFFPTGYYYRLIIKNYP